MSEGFIKGDAKELKLIDVIPLNMKSSFLTREKKEEIASTYEREHPQTIVVRDWEEVPDEVLNDPSTSADERKQIIEDRRRLADRRAKRKAAEPEVVPTLSGDPDRMAHELRRVRAQVAGLTIDHPEYDKLWTNYVRTIHELEDVCGLEHTEYVKGHKIEKAAESPVPPELLVKVEKYKKLPREKRERSLLAGENPELIRLLRDNEPDIDLQDLAVQRLMQLGAIA